MERGKKGGNNVTFFLIVRMVTYTVFLILPLIKPLDLMPALRTQE